MNQPTPKEFTPSAAPENQPVFDQRENVPQQEQYQKQESISETAEREHIPEIEPSPELIQEKPPLTTEDEGFLDETIDALKQKLNAALKEFDTQFVA